MTKMPKINCGERNVQKGFRLAIRDICERYDIKEGESVELYIKKVK